MGRTDWSPIRPSGRAPFHGVLTEFSDSVVFEPSVPWTQGERSMTSSGAMFVVDLDLETAPKAATAFGRHVSTGGPFHQAGRHQHSDVVYEDPFVGLCILALEMGVDRHLGASASGNWRDEVQSSRAAFASHQRQGFVVQRQIKRGCHHLTIVGGRFTMVEIDRSASVSVYLLRHAVGDSQSSGQRRQYEHATDNHQS